MLKKIIQKAAGWLGLGRVLGLASLILFLSIRAVDPTPLESLRLKVFDFYQQYQPRPAKALPIAIVDIDDASLKAHGQWPWPRTRLAELVTGITQAGAVAMAFDIVFAEQDRLSPSLVADNVSGLDPETRARLKTLPSNDDVLGRAFMRSRVIVGQSGHHRQTDDAGKAKLQQTSIAVLGTDPKRHLVNYPGLLRNVPVLEKTAKGRGLFTVAPDFDGVIRRVPIVMQAQGLIAPALSTELLRVATGSKALLLKSEEAGIRSVVVGGVEVPTDKNGQLWLYFSRHNPKRFVSAVDVINKTSKAKALAGKLVLIGTSAIGLHDIRATPMGTSMPGVEIHAQILENILTRTFLKRPLYMVGAEICLAILAGLLMIWLAPRAPAIRVFLLGGMLIAIVGAVSWYLFTSSGILLDTVFPSLSTTAIFIVLVSANYFREETQRRQIRGAFGQYLSPALVEQLAEHPEQLVLGGETRNMTILFSDVRGFTTISELYKTDPEGLTSLMNDFLTPISNAIIEHRGTIDKYMGDAVMAFWNAPLDDPDHAANACKTAFDMLDRLRSLNEMRAAQARESSAEFLPIEVGIGINTADCAVGNMGSDVHFNYSVMGDGVNLASRLEGQTKAYGVPIIIGAETAKLLDEDFAILEIDTIRVKGKLEPEVISTLLGRGEIARSKTFSTLKDGLADMIAHYRSGDWSRALKALRQCRKSAADYDIDGYFDLFETRIKEFQKTAPPKGWDGVFTHETK